MISKIKESSINLDVIRREIQIHIRLIHDNIIRLFSYHEDENSFYLIFDDTISSYANVNLLNSEGMFYSFFVFIYIFIFDF